MPARSKKAPAANATIPKTSQPAMTTKPVISNGVPASMSTNHTAADSETRAEEMASPAEDASSAPQVNRKKQKRREKEAAKKAAEQQIGNGIQNAAPAQNGQAAYPAPGRGPRKGYFNEEPDYVDPDFADEPLEAEEAFYSGDEDLDYPLYDSSATWQQQNNAQGKKRKNKRNSGIDLPHRTTPHAQTLPPRNSALVSRPSLSNAALRSAHKMSNEQIWNTSSQAERDNIKQFWLELGEEERRSLVKVEKEAVLRKMKEQQKHSCSCSVCGRKRTAIEEELEVLYDAYYEELEQFANNGNDLSNGHPMLSASRAYRQIRSPAQPMAGSFPSRGRVHEMGEDEELDDEEYDDEDEPYSDEEYDEPGPPDFFTFGNSLTVKDGILTVADDLLKNDGKHFIDMMEQLAERRMQRHNHPPLDEDDDYDDDEDDEDYDSQEDDEFENDEMDSMTEEQRMEEGRRMFQIFAARMFEQRVLTAYREKVAAERQKKLLDELEQEGQLDAQREAKKAREAAKKKEKKRLQKQAKDEEKAKKDAEKAAQEAAAREEQEKKLEEQRQKKEEQRKKREAERKAAEDERQRKEADKQRRAQEERERQAEAERKQREAKEREKKKREETKQKERTEREAKEKEVREFKAKQDQERRANHDGDRREKDATLKPGHGTLKRQPIALPPGLQPPAQVNNTQSPLLPIATPMLPIKVPTPGRHRQTSHQGQQSSHASSPRSQHAMTETSHSSASPASVAIPQTPAFGSVPMKSQNQAPMLYHPQPSAPLSPLNQQTRNGHLSFNMNGGPGLGLNGPGMSAPGIMHNGPQMQNFGPPMPGQQRFGPPQGMPYPPGFNAPRQYGQAQQMPFHSQAPMPPPISAPHSQQQQPLSHSRQPSGSQQETMQPAPIGGNRPGPVGRPSSAAPEKQPRQVSGSKALLGDSDVDNLATHLGSKALLDDDADVPFVSSQGGAAKVNIPLGPPGSGRAPFSSSFGDGKFDSMGLVGPNWGGFSPNVQNASSWGAPGPNPRNSGGWNQQASNAFGSIGAMHSLSTRSHASRPFTIRNLLAQACRQLSSAPGSAGDGFIPASNVLRQVEAMKSSGDAPVTMDEMLTYCETEGNAQNGGGSFEVRTDGNRGPVVKFSSDASPGGRSSVGDIGSPIVSHGQPTSFGGIGHGFGAHGRGF